MNYYTRAKCRMRLQILMTFNDNQRGKYYAGSNEITTKISRS